MKQTNITRISPEVLKHRTDSRRHFLQKMQGMDYTDAATVSFIVSVMLETHFDPREIAELVGADRTSVIRWSTGDSVPRSPGFRKWLSETLIDYISNSITPDRPSNLANGNNGSLLSTRSNSKPLVR